MDIQFCDLCNESVPKADMDLGWAAQRGGRIICLRCEAAMTRESGGGPQAKVQGAGGAPAGGGVAVSGAPAIPHGAGSAARSEAQTASSSHGPDRASARAEIGTRDPLAESSTPEPSQAAGQGAGLGWVALVFAAGATAFLVDWGRRTQGDMEQRFERTAARASEAEQRSRRRAGELAAQLAESEARLREEFAEGLAPVLEQVGKLRADLERHDRRFEEEQQALELVRSNGDARHRTYQLTFDRQAALLERIDTDQRSYRDRIIKLEEDLRGISKGAIPRSLLPGGGEATSSDGTPTWQGILPDLEHASSAIRLEAVYALGDTKDLRVVPHLLPRLKDEDLFVRLATARILEALDAEEGIPGLIDALEDRETAVREAAVLALRSITGQNFRFEASASEADRSVRVRAWRAWYEKQGK